MNQQQVFQKISKGRTQVANIFKEYQEFLVGVNAHYDFYQQIMLRQDLPLSREIREFLAMGTSISNQCDYCISHHKKAFELQKNEIKEELKEFLRKMIQVITHEPWKSSVLKSEARTFFSNEQFDHAVMIISYFNMANRLAFAKNIELEEDYHQTCH